MRAESDDGCASGRVAGLTDRAAGPEGTAFGPAASAGSTHTVPVRSDSAMCSACRIASATIVSVGFAAAPVVN